MSLRTLFWGYSRRIQGFLLKNVTLYFTKNMGFFWTVILIIYISTLTKCSDKIIKTTQYIYKLLVLSPGLEPGDGTRALLDLLLQRGVQTRDSQAVSGNTENNQNTWTNLVSVLSIVNTKSEHEYLMKNILFVWAIPLTKYSKESATKESSILRHRL